MEPLIATFHIDWKIIIAQMVNFGLVFLVLYMFALKPLMALMLARTEKIVKGLADAKENSTVLEKSKKDYEDALTKARKEAQVLFDAGKKEAEQKREAMLVSTKAEVDKMIEDGKKILEAEKVKMLMENFWFNSKSPILILNLVQSYKSTILSSLISKIILI